MSIEYAFVCCQQGAEQTVKAELAPQGWRLAFSRPGFVTLKSDGADALPQGVFVRAASQSIGRASGTQAADLVQQIMDQLPSDTVYDALHLWPRDRTRVGQFGFRPGPTELSEAIADFVLQRLHAAGRVRDPNPNPLARPGDRVLDIVLVDPDHWFAGWHTAAAAETCWPGGVFPEAAREDVISRAYYKAAEALAWSRFPLRPGDRCAEIGSAPGGACQRLLEMGMRVIGIDPADMDERVLEHPDFQHVRARGGDIPRADYRGVRWLLIDSNVRPDQTLVTVENVVTNRRVNIAGMLITLKLPTYGDARNLPAWLELIRSWGYGEVRARQLAMGRQEVCVAARKVKG